MILGKTLLGRGSSALGRGRTAAPGPLTLLISDNGDGTGGVATITGSTGTNNLYYALVGNVSNLDWILAGSIAGDGSITLTQNPGLYLWSLSSNGSYSLPIYQALTTPAPIMGPDQETSQAMLVKWTASAALGVLVPGGLHKDNLVPSTVSEMPYARIEVTKSKPPMYSTGGRFIDYCEATITIFGVGDVAVSEIVPTVQAVLDEKPLHFRVGVDWMRTEVLDVTVAEQEEIKGGEEYRAAIFRWCVWTDRKVPQ